MSDTDTGAAAPANPAAPVVAPIVALQALHDVACRKLDALKTQLAASLEKAKGDPGHFGAHEAYVRDIGLKADEIAAWIGRSV